MSDVPVGSRNSIRRGVQLDCEVVSANADEPLRYRATDLSQRGIWLQTARPVRTGETVVVCFAPADGREHEELWVFGEVARVTTQRRADDDTPGVGMGIEFVDLSAAEKTRIEVWLHTQRAPVPRRRRPVRAPRPAPPALPVCWR